MVLLRVSWSNIASLYHPILREAMRRLLEREPDLNVIGEASDGAEAVKVTRHDCKPLLFRTKSAIPVTDVSLAREYS